MSENELESDHKKHWQWYRDLFNVTVLRYLVTWFAVVPILIRLIAIPLKSIQIGDNVVINFDQSAHLPFGLLVLWLSSLFYVIALLIYQWRCPSFIKTYHSFSDYKKHEHSPRWIVWESGPLLNDKNEMDKFFDRLTTKKLVEQYSKIIKRNIVIVEEKQTAAYFTKEGTTYRLALPVISGGNIDDAKTRLDEKEIFWEVFGRFSSSRPFWRGTIRVLLWISMILFAATLVDHIYAGLSFFWNQMEDFLIHFDHGSN